MQTPVEEVDSVVETGEGREREKEQKKITKRVRDVSWKGRRREGGKLDLKKSFASFQDLIFSFQTSAPPHLLFKNSFFPSYKAVSAIKKVRYRVIRKKMS